jgi:hypothetical protein
LEAIGYSRLHLLTKLDQNVSLPLFAVACLLTSYSQEVQSLLSSTGLTQRTAPN